MTIEVAYNDEQQVKKLRNLESESLNFLFYNESTLKGKKKAWSLKSHWSARATPFVLISDEEKPLRALYSEADSDVIQTLLNYLKDE